MVFQGTLVSSTESRASACRGFHPVTFIQSIGNKTNAFFCTIILLLYISVVLFRPIFEENGY